MKRTKVVTVIDGIEITELTTENLEGDPVERSYYVQGEKFSGLKEAMAVAARISDDVFG